MGPFDAVASRYGLVCQNADRIALTKLDVLSGMDQIPVITAYQQGGCEIRDFDPSATAMSTGVTILRILSPFYFVVSAKLVADGILRGAGLMNRFMVATFTDLIIRVVLAFAFSRTSLGATAIWFAWPVGWTIACVLSILFYRTGPWNHKDQQEASAA